MDGDARQRGTIANGQTLPQELLDNGQGKSVSLDMEISNSSKGEDPPSLMVHYNNNCNGMPHHLLLPPVIEATGSITTGATTNILRKQNKHHRTEAILWQPVATQWITHQGNNILPRDHWEGRHKTSDEYEMPPQGLALQHEAAALLTDWERFGCPM